MRLKIEPSERDNNRDAYQIEQGVGAIPRKQFNVIAKDAAFR